MSNLSAEQRKGLAYLQSILRYAYIPGNTDIAELFVRKEGKKESPAFSGDVTVEEVLEASLNADDLDEGLIFAAGEAYNMLEQMSEEVSFFMENPDGSGRIPVEKDGLKVLMVDGQQIRPHGVDQYMKMKEDLGDFLSNSGQGGHTVKADLNDKKVWGRLLCKDTKGNFKPISIDFAKLTGNMKEDRLQVLADVEKYFKNSNLYVKDDNGVISKVEMAKDRSIYRGAFEDDSLKAAAKNELADAHGSVAMFLMRLLQSIGIHWFDDMIKEQELVEQNRDAQVSAQKESRYAEIKLRDIESSGKDQIGEFTRQAPALIKRGMTADEFQQLLQVMAAEGASDLETIYTIQRVEINHDALIARAMYEPARDLLLKAGEAENKEAFLTANCEAFLLYHETVTQALRGRDLNRLNINIRNARLCADADRPAARLLVISELQELDEQVRNIYRAQARQNQKDLKQESKNNEKEVPVKKEPQKELENQPAPMKK